MTAPTDQEVIEELQETATLAEQEVIRLREKVNHLQERNRALLVDRTADRHIIRELVNDSIGAAREHAALVAKCHEAHDAHIEAEYRRRLVFDLYSVIVHNISHKDDGDCPGGRWGWERRDTECPACTVMSRADDVIGGAA